MRLLVDRAFLKSTLPEADKQRCYLAIEQFKNDPFRPGLYYKRLGKGPRQNHCSIRASQELRVILAVDPNFQPPGTVVLANMGHHDEMYDWAKRQGYSTDPKEAVAVDSVVPAQVNAGNPFPTLDSFDEWQIFLHPDQAPLVKAQYAAAARIRGSAGTGKTVVALHRAKELGHRYADERVLFTTFSRSLTEHLKGLYFRMPNPATNVEFTNIDKVASDLVKRPWINRSTLKTTFDWALQAVIPGTALDRCSPDYLKEEIQKVIKGRAATREVYLDTDRFERLGRRRKFNRTDREICWRLREEWDKRMRVANTIDFADTLIAARDRASERDHGEYRAAIVDEAQDMTLVGMQLVRALVAGDPGNPVPPDGLLILDDAAQRIYAGGFRLGWAGIQVTGRSEILRTNYRNTKPVVDAALAVRGDTLLVREDNDDGAALHAGYEREEGPTPAFLLVGKNGEAKAVADKIAELVREQGFAHETIGVLTRSNNDSDKIKKWLDEQWEIPCASLRDMRGDGALGSGVRVGTFDRSKGLEFRAVLIPRLGSSVFPKAEDEDEAQSAIPRIRDAPAEPTEEQREARQLDLDRLYVGMTRAKERLYLIADEAPCQEIERARDLMDWQRLV